MGIAALPANAARSIGTSQCLTDPASLVKELVDNALDAGATSIFVEITANTTNRVKVRDNGLGIVPEDRSLACKRHCTSKIRSLEDLRDLGGQSLGFRGEALASAAEMSAKMLLITRVEGEATAIEIEYARNGLVKGEKRVSHPVGTTVQVDDFLSNSPVRKQTAWKHSVKYLANIKKLLQKFVLARPHIRLSLKILKANSTKGDWSYAPRPGVNHKSDFMSLALDTAIKVFGTKVAEALRFHTSTWSSAGEVMDPVLPEGSRSGAASRDVYALQCFLIDPKCTNMEIFSALGQHISIDNRPVSSNRGVLKLVGAHYKSCLRSAADHLGSVKIIDPLLVINISCPKGSYDINVEPAKDDVLFADAKVVLQVIQMTLNNIYGEPRNHQEQRPAQPQTRESDGFGVLLAKKTIDKEVLTSGQPPPQAEVESGLLNGRADFLLNLPADGVNANTEDLSQNAGGVVPDERSDRPLDDEQETGVSAKTNTTWKASIFSSNDDDLELYSTLSASSQAEIEPANEEENPQSIDISNPWILAKLNARFRTPMKRIENDRVSISKARLPTPQQQRGDVANGLEVPSDDCQQSPSTSAAFFPYPLRAFGKHQTGEDTAEVTSTSELGCGALDSWVQRSNASSSLDSNERNESWIPNANHRSYPDFGPMNNQPRRGMALHDIPRISQRPTTKTAIGKQRTRTINERYISPASDPERVWFEMRENSNAHRPQQRLTKTKARSKSISLRESEGHISPPLEAQPHLMHPDLAIALDYEARKVQATHDHKENLRREKAAEIARQHAEAAKQRTLDSLLGLRAPHATPNSPHQLRQAKAIAALQANVETAAADAVESSDQATRPSSKQKKSTKLPLESVKEQYWVSDLILPFATNNDMFVGQVRRLVDWDDYVYRGEVGNGFDNVERGLLKIWESQLRQLVGNQYRRGDPHVEDGATIGENEIVLDLCGILSEPGLDDA